MCLCTCACTCFCSMRCCNTCVSRCCVILASRSLCRYVFENRSLMMQGLPQISDTYTRCPRTKNQEQKKRERGGAEERKPNTIAAMSMCQTQPEQQTKQPEPNKATHTASAPWLSSFASPTADGGDDMLLANFLFWKVHTLLAPSFFLLLQFFFLLLCVVFLFSCSSFSSCSSYRRK